MALQDFVDALPEDKREAYRAEISKAVVITTEAEAEAFAGSNELLRKANQRYRDGKLEETKKEFLKNFHEKELPALLDAERKKGQKQPWEIEIENLKKENEVARNEGLREKQKNRALAKAQELGIPASLVDPYLGLTDEETDTRLKALIDTVVPYRENAVKEALKNIGSQPNPRGAGYAEPKDLNGQYDDAVKAGNADLALALQSRLQEQALHRS